MNFFEHQDRTRRNTKLLVVLFILATLGTVVAVDVVFGIVLGMSGSRVDFSALVREWIRNESWQPWRLPYEYLVAPKAAPWWRAWPARPAQTSLPATT